jgi:hypothetical protein
VCCFCDALFEVAVFFNCIALLCKKLLANSELLGSFRCNLYDNKTKKIHDTRLLAQPRVISDHHDYMYTRCSDSLRDAAEQKMCVAVEYMPVSTSIACFNYYLPLYC